MMGKSPYNRLKEIIKDKKLKIDIDKLKEFPYLELDKRIEELKVIS